MNVNCRLSGGASGAAVVLWLSFLTPILAAGSNATPIDVDPKQLGQWRPDEKSILKIRGIAFSGSLAFLAADRGGVQILDVSDTSGARRIGKYSPESAEAINAIILSGKYAYVSGARSPLIILDVSDPALPRKLSSFEDDRGMMALGMVALQDHVYMVGPGWFRVFDVSNDADPALVWEDESQVYTSIALAGTRLIVGGDFGLRVYVTSNPSRPEPIATLPTPTPGAVAVDGDYAYVIPREWMGNGEISGVGLEIFSLAEAAQPQHVASVATTGRPKAITAVGQRVFLALETGDVVDGGTATMAEGGTVLAFDMSNPGQPRRVGIYNDGLLYSYPMAIAAAGRTCLLATGRVGWDEIPLGALLDVIDVSEVGALQRRGTFRDPAGWGEDVVAADGYVYVADRLAGLLVFDIANPLRPELIADVNTGRNDWNLAMTGSTVCIGNRGYWDGTKLVDAGVRIVDVASPTRPRLIGRFDTKGRVVDLATRDRFCYVLDDQDGLLVLDLSVPAAPRLTGSSAACFGSQLVAVDNHLYIASDGLRVVDASNPSKPEQVGAFGGAFVATAIAAAGTRVWLLDPERGVFLIDVSDPRKPALIGSSSMTPAPYGNSISASGPLAFAPYYQSLELLTAEGFGAPRRIGRFTSPNMFFTTGVALSGSVACMTFTQAGGLQLVDLGARANPQRIGGSETILSASQVQVQGNYAYLSSYLTGFQVVDITNPTAPERIGFCDTPGIAWGLAINGRHAFIADGDSGLQIVNISDARKPALIASAATPGDAHGVAAAGAYAYVVGRLGFWIFDISDPLRPKLAGRLDSNTGLRGVSVSGSRVYIGAGERIGEIDVSEPSRPQLIAWHPVGWPGPTFPALTASPDLEEGWLLHQKTTDGSSRRVGGYQSMVAALGVAVDRGYAYVPQREAGLEVFDLADLLQPKSIGRSTAMASATSVIVSAGKVLVTSESSKGDGLVLLEMLPFFKSSSRTAGRLHLAWEGWGQAQLEVSSNPSANDWRPVDTPTTSMDALLSAEGDRGFFRLRRAE